MEECNNRGLLSYFFYMVENRFFVVIRIIGGVFMVKIIGEKRLRLWLNAIYEDNSWHKKGVEAFAAQD